jgi:hypothetical protein
MVRKVSVGTLVTALLLSGVLMGVSRGDPGPTAAAPASFRLLVGHTLSDASEGLDDQTACEARWGGERVGTILWNSTGTGRNWHVTIVYKVTDPSIGIGSLVATGIFRGFNGEQLAVTGGTGAYVGADGAVTLSVENDRFAHTFELMA